VLAYVPFAKDAVGYAVSPNSVMPALSIGAPSDAAVNGVTPNTLWAIYNCSATRIITKTGVPTKLVDNTYVKAGDETSTRIRAYIPQSGSGTRDFWMGKATSVFGSSITNCAEDKVYNAAQDSDGADNLVNFSGGADYSGASVQEHNGSALVGDAGAITPFSIPKWIAMAKRTANVAGFSGVTDVRNNAVIGNLNGVPAMSGAGATLEINPDFITNAETSKVTRTVYNVVPYRTVTDPTSLEYKMFKGRTSLVCSKASVIRSFGFSPLTAVSGANSCGDTSVRAITAVPATVSTETATANEGTKAIDFAVSGFGSNGTGGAKVYVQATSTVDAGNVITANEANPALIAPGATSVDFALPYTALPSGSWKLRLVIVPNLPGVATYTSGSDLVTKSGANTTLTAKVSGKVKKFGKAVITVAASSGTPTGTVTVHKGTSAAGKVIGTAPLTAGSATITTLSKQRKRGSVKVFIVYSGDATNAASSTAATWRVR
jgi:hypothetical protein